MKILFIAENWPPRVGGIENYLTGLAGELAKQHEVVALAPSVGQSDPRIESGVTDGLTTIRKRFFWPIIKPAWLPLYLFIHRLAAREQFDVVLCGKGLFEGLIGYYLKKRLGIPYVVFTYYMEISEWQKKPSTLRKLKRVLDAADRVVVITEVVREKIETLGVVNKNIIKIYPAVDEGFVAALEKKLASDSVLVKYGIEKPYILSVGRLIERKGFDDLIRAFAKLDQTKFGDIDLVIVGDGPERERLEKLAEREYVRPLFLSNVPNEDLPALYVEAQLFALTPKEIGGDAEGFGIVYLEAGAASLPILGTKTGGVPEAITDGTTGLLVPPEDVDAIHIALVKLLTNTDLRTRMGKAGRQRVYSEARWSGRAKELYKYLEAI